MTNWDGIGRKVLMIVLNGVEHDNRVLKTARHVQSTGADVTIFGISLDREMTRPTLRRIDGVRARLFPHPRHARVNSGHQSVNYLANQHQLLSSFLSYAETMEPDVLYTHDYNTLSIGFEIARTLRRRDVGLYWVHDLHEYVEGLSNIDDGVRRQAADEQARLIHAPDHLVTVSPPLAEALKRDHGLAQRPSVVLNANGAGCMDIAAGTVRATLGLAPDVPLAVYTGGVAPARGVHTLVAALAELPDLHVALITNNTGAYVETLRERAQADGTAERLHWLPYVAPDAVPSFIRDASVGVHPMVHFENAEVALPNKLFDYCLAGVPVVVSDCRSMAAFVRRWEIGAVFAAEDVSGLAQAIRAVLAERDRYVRHLGQGGELLDRFAWERQCAVLSQVLDRAHEGLGHRALGEQDVGPEHSGGPVVADRAPGARRAPPGPPDVIGAVTGVAEGRILGWVSDRNHPETPPMVDVFYRDEMIEGATATRRETVLIDGEARAVWAFDVTFAATYRNDKARRFVLRASPGDRVLSGTPGLFVLGAEPSWMPDGVAGS